MIYLVEDDDSIRELVLYTLHTTGFEAEGFRNAADFWQALEKELPQLVLLDIMLPDEDGLHILKRLRAGAETRPEFPAPPLLFFLRLKESHSNSDSLRLHTAQ